jgi:ribosomal protein L37AE/L43A
VDAARFRSSQARRAQARSLNAAIDRALLETAAEYSRRAVEWPVEQDTSATADRVRIRARRLAATDRMRRNRILKACDALVSSLYRRAAPAGWLCAWCDASVAADALSPVAGIGAIIQDESGQTIVKISRRIPHCDPFDAEVAALAATLEAAHALAGATARIRVYTDCPALARLWLRNPRDPRLSAVSALARRLRRFEPCALPRRHNQAAHRLARNAAPHRA